jgi:hypothetical protein
MSSAPVSEPRVPRTFEAIDARADGRRRVVRVDRENIVIARAVRGVLMRIVLAIGAYRGVLLRIAGLDDGRFQYEVVIAHRDPDLGVALARCDDEAEARAEWSRWARFLALPTLVERVEGVYESARPTAGALATSEPSARRRGRVSRRARFLTRRKVGRLELCARVDPGRVLFDGWREEG